MSDSFSDPLNTKTYGHHRVLGEACCLSCKFLYAVRDQQGTNTDNCLPLHEERQQDEEDEGTDREDIWNQWRASPNDPKNTLDYHALSPEKHGIIWCGKGLQFVAVSVCLIIPLYPNATMGADSESSYGESAKPEVMDDSFPNYTDKWKTFFFMSLFGLFHADGTVQWRYQASTFPVAKYDIKVTGRTMHSSFHVSFMGGLGVGSNLDNFSKEEIKEAAGWIKLYKQVRHIMQHGDLDWLLVNLARVGDLVAATQTTTHDQSEAVVLAFRYTTSSSPIL
ncbi:hypothetical protein VTP01DRAFT_2549 [Rhizomucor pusillus]|uniref:uncharacterized protein n=1 Tax=Rhizomucor pusillus TaxID=4840 RepID=UPI003742C2A6